MRAFTTCFRFAAVAALGLSLAAPLSADTTVRLRDVATLQGAGIARVTPNVATAATTVTRREQAGRTPIIRTPC